MSSIAFQYAVYFIYGLTFFSMGLVMLLESWRVEDGTPQVGLIRPLAIFGLLHGTHEWLEIFILQMEYIDGSQVQGLKWFRLFLLGISFIALWVYSVAAFRFAREHIAGFTIFGLVTLPIFAILILIDISINYSLGRISTYHLVGSSVRYGLGVIGAAVATMGLLAAATKSKADGRVPLDRYLTVTAVGFGAYSVTQLFVPAMRTSLASWLNTTTFLNVFGFPIQVVRALSGLIITTGLIAVTRFLERERQQFLAEARAAHLGALEEKDAIRRDLFRQVVRAQEDERSRISRELHDEMAQTLTALTLDISSLEQLAGKRSKFSPILSRLRNLGDEMSRDMSRMVRDLRPALLDDLGLVSALRYLADNERKRSKFEVSFEIIGAPIRFGTFAETVLYRVAQEALNNIARHANPAAVKIELKFEEVSIGLMIKDDGIGFDPSEAFLPPRGLGMEGMRERVAATGGTLDIDSTIGAGTTVVAVIPINPAEGN